MKNNKFVINNHGESVLNWVSAVFVALFYAGAALLLSEICVLLFSATAALSVYWVTIVLDFFYYVEEPLESLVWLSWFVFSLDWVGINATSCKVLFWLSWAVSVAILSVSLFS